jgi:hypothetical protein
MPAPRAHRKTILTLALAISAAASGCHGGKTPPSGDVAASLAIQTLDGRAFDPQVLRGKPAIVTFWRPGCPYCAAALPKDQAAAHRTGATAIAIMISGGDDAGTAELQHLGWDGAALVDRGALATRYGVPHVPYSFVLRPDGTAARVFDGDEASEDDIASALEAAR